MKSIETSLSPGQLASTRRLLAEESARRRHVVIAVSGAHAYGFPSPDSDVDVKAFHLEPTAHLLGLGAPRASFDRLEIIDGVEVDYTSNELAAGLAGILGGNGNYLERVLGELILTADAMLDELRELSRAAVSRRYFHHYRGFAAQQLAAVDQAGDAATAKKVLYVLRTALTGAHLMATGELRGDLEYNLDDSGFSAARELIAAKCAGERTALGAERIAAWRSELDRALRELERARDASPLPEEAPNRAAMESWLIEVRKRNL